MEMFGQQLRKSYFLAKIMVRTGIVKISVGDYTMVFFPVYKEYNESEHGETPPDFTPKIASKRLRMKRSCLMKI